MTSTRSALDADWLGVCRRAVRGLGELLSASPTTAERAVETGSRGRGGDRTLVIDRGAESVVLGELDRLREEGFRFAAFSEERGEVDYGDPTIKVIIDPIDGSLNAKRRIPHYALSIAVADGSTMADVAFAFVHDFGPREEWWARRGEGAVLNGRPPNVDLAALAAESEARVTAYTGLRPVRPLPKPEGIGRREWVASNIDAMRTLLDPVLERAGKSLGALGPAMDIGAGLVLSTEVGVIVGYLAQRVLGQYEVVLLDEAVEDRPPRLLFVLPNLGQAVQAFGAEEQELMTWVALHEVTHAVQFAGVPWLHSHVAGLARELLKSAEVRIEAPRKLRLPSGDEIRRIFGALRKGDLVSIVTTTAERATLDRVQAVMAVIEGHAEHVMDAVAPDLLPSLPRLRAALDRRRRSQTGLSRLVARLLGLDLKLRQYEQGKAFCDAVVRERGPAALEQLWQSPESLPTLAGVEDPAAWLERIMPEQLDEARRSRA